MYEEPVQSHAVMFQLQRWVQPMTLHVMLPYRWTDTAPYCRYSYKTVDNVSCQSNGRNLDAKLYWL